jgi:putative CRISPR-associated protein (TIGR02619 family)
MNKLIISTIGTSLLTNQIDRANPEEKTWYSQLRDAANLSETETPIETRNIIQKLRLRASRQLRQNNIKKNRAISAELNGLYGLYNEELISGKSDIHYLISTDTYQCHTTATVIAEFLQNHELPSVQILTPPGLSTSSNESFSSGIDELIVKLREIIPAYRDSGYEIYFNLVGSFKSLQAYLNTIGMFYADKILYIFEGEGAQLITIPRLPISLNCQAIEPYITEFALMAAGAELPVNDHIPESLVLKIDNIMSLSIWGNLVWGECKKTLLSQELLILPRLEFENSFRQDYKKISISEDRIKLQEVLAKVSGLLEQNKGDTNCLNGGIGVKYYNYTNKQLNGQPIGHFRISKGLRVSCIAKDGKLYLRKYGKEPVVNNNP